MADDVRHAIPCDELRTLRLEHNMTFEQIAAHYGCGSTSIQRRCLDCGIGRRWGITAAQQARRANVDPERLRSMYVDRNLSEKEVGAALGHDSRTIRQELRRHGIALRPRGGATPRRTAGLDADVLRRLVITEGKTDAEIGRMYDVTGGSIAGLRRRRGIRKEKADFDRILTREYLEAEYAVKRRSASDIARDVGCSEYRIWKKIHGYKIPQIHRVNSKEYVRLCRIKGAGARRRMSELLGGRCSVCRTRNFGQRHIHHMWYVPDDVIYAKYKSKPYGRYHMDLLQMVESSPDRFRLLCQSCHFAVGKVESIYKHAGLDGFLAIISEMDAARSGHPTTYKDCLHDASADADGFEQ